MTYKVLKRTLRQTLNISKLMEIQLITKNTHSLHHSPRATYNRMWSLANGVNCVCF